MVKNEQYEAAIGRYSELIMQLRALDNEENIEWDDKGRLATRSLKASAYLNLSLCFLKTKQWTHANNTATRAIQGDMDPPDAKDDVLEPVKKAKALFRRAQAQSQGFSDFSKALVDLKKAHELAPEDKAIQQELAKIDRELTKASKAADKKMAGFLNASKKVKDGEGIFDDSIRPEEGFKAKPFTEPMKMSDGLWLYPGKEEEKQEKDKSDGRVDFDELTREVNEMKEDNPEAYAELCREANERLKEEVAAMKKEKEEKEKAGAGEPGSEAAAADGGDAAKA